MAYDVSDHWGFNYFLQRSYGNQSLSKESYIAVLSTEDPEDIESNAPDCVVLCIPSTIDLFSPGDLFSHLEDTLENFGFQIFK